MSKVRVDGGDCGDVFGGFGATSLANTSTYARASYYIIRRVQKHTRNKIIHLIEVYFQRCNGYDQTAVSANIIRHCAVL